MFFTIKIFLCFFFLSLSAFFSCSEIALTSLSAHNLRTLRHKYRILVPGLLLWQKEPNRILTAILIGNNLVNIGIIVLASSLAFDLVPLWEGPIPGHWLSLIFPLLALLMIIFLGEIIPKIYGRLQGEKVVLYSVPFLYFFVLLLRPLVTFFVTLANIFIAPFGKRLSKEVPFITPREFKLLLQSREMERVFRREVRLILGRILDFAQKSVGQVMIPREKIFAVNLNEPREKIILKVAHSGYSRVPVYKDSLDNIVGIIYAKDLLYTLHNAGLFLITDLIRPAYFVFENNKVNELLREFRRGHYHLAIVRNEKKQTCGIITIEDLVEEIVGEISDEYKSLRTKIPLKEVTASSSPTNGMSK